MKKTLHFLLFAGLGYLLPMVGRPELILHPRLLLLMGACGIVMATQPAIDFRQARDRQSTDRSTFFIILIFSLVSVATPVLEWAYLLQGDNGWIWYAIGLGFLIPGLFLRIWAIRTLGRHFTVTVQINPDQQVITHGPYAWVRHPSYLGAWLAFVGSGLLLGALMGAGLAAVLMFLAYYWRIQAEERTLLQEFGHIYNNYRVRTFRLFPGFW